MRKIIPRISPCANRHYTCSYAVLDSLLRFFGYDPTVVCFNNWDFAYHRGEMCEIVGRLTPIDTALKVFGLAHCRREVGNACCAWEEVKALVDAQIPAALDMNVYPLAEAGLFPCLQRAIQPFILTGYDEEERKVHLLDASPWLSKEMHVSFDLFCTSWDASALCPAADGKYSWHWIEPPGECFSLTPATLAVFLQRNIQVMAAQSKVDHLALGVQGVECWADDLGAWSGEAESPLRARLERYSTSLWEIALLREGHGSFLRRAAEFCDRPRLSGLGWDFERISQRWFAVRNLFSRGIREEPTALVPRIQTGLRGIAAEERAALATLADILD